MSELFGIDIQGLVTDSLSGQLRPIFLTRTVKGIYDPILDEETETTETYTTEGIAPSYSSVAGRNEMLQAGLLRASEVPILMLAKPLGTDPQTGDRLEIDGETYTITGVIERDPSGSTWTVKGEA